MASTIFNATDMTQEVYNANAPYYSSVYQELDRSKQIAAGAVNSAYDNAVASAYAQSQQGMSQIGGSNLGSGYKTALQSGMQAQLNQAYDQFQAGRAQDVYNATADYQKASDNLTAGIQKEGLALGQKVADYNSEAVTGYLSYLNKQGMLEAGKYSSYADFKAANPNSQLTEGQFRAQNAINSKYSKIFDKNGNMNYDELKMALFGERDEKGELTGKMTADLNTVGIDMMDQLHNVMSTDQFDSYSQWLSKNDKNLYEWSIQRSVISGDRNMAQTAMKYMGADDTYSFVERFGGLTEKQTTKLFGDFDKSLSLLTANTGNYETVQAQNAATYRALVKNADDMFKELGLTAELGGVSMSEIIVDRYATQNGMSRADASKALGITITTPGWQTRQYTWTEAVQSGGTVAGAVIGGVLGAIAGFFLGGPIGAIAGGVAGAAAGAATGTAITYITHEKTVMDDDANRNLVNNQKAQLENSIKQFSVSSAALAAELRKQKLAEYAR
jgi:outer membrane lipoprotein SlyB